MSKQIHFSKMHGAGNDFVVIETNHDFNVFTPCANLIRNLCNRTRGIGADGVILLSKTCENNVIQMIFYNNDGKRAEMCGNGLRCAAWYAKLHEMSSRPETTFLTDSGKLHTKYIKEQLVQVEIKINKDFQSNSELIPNQTVYHGIAGVPHALLPVSELEKMDIREPAKHLRFHKFFGENGTNVDFIEFDHKFSEPIHIRTYERGIEEETEACGTGIAAAAVVLRNFFNAPWNLSFKTRNGDSLSTCYQQGNSVFLTGPAIETFTGTINSNFFENNHQF